MAPGQVVTKNRKLLFLVTEDWYFCSHRLALAVAAKERGYRVAVATRINRHADVIRNAGIELFPLRLDRSGRNPVRELSTIAEIHRIYRTFRPDLVHHVALKPMLYGSTAAFLARVPAIVNAMPGRGFVFLSEEPLARALRPFVRAGFRFMLSRPSVRVILQNPDDIGVWTSSGVVSDGQISLIRGCGINTDKFHAAPEPEGVPVVTLPARMLWDKGVGEFVEAARILKRQGVACIFRLAGSTDAANPASIPESTLCAWHDEGIVEWLGWCDDMPSVYRGSHVVCLPSYAEGLPQALLEAASCGRPLVATDVPGCREAVRSGINGALVPVRDAAALAAALRPLLESASRRQELGRNSRQMVEQEFAAPLVIDQFLSTFDRLLDAVA